MIKNVTKVALSVPDRFEFPFKPYNIQIEFMANLYSAMEHGKLAIFESPTGTGKTMSIICAAVRWLKDHEEQEKQYLQNLIDDFDRMILKYEQDEQNEDDWISLQSEKLKIRAQKNEVHHQLQLIKLHEDSIQKIRTKKSLHERTSNKANEALNNTNDESDDDLILEEPIHLPKEANDDSIEENENNQKHTQILICSRTHSQLTQFVQEFQKSPHGHDTRVVILSSRQNYCINDSVRKLKNITLMNERCSDLVSGNLRKDKTKSTEKRAKIALSCPYLVYVDDIHDSILRHVQDIETLVSESRKYQGCPYYASKKALSKAQIVLMPYNNLLHKATRLSNGVRLKDNIVIIDEAHNLLEALESMYSCELQKNHLQSALDLLEAYRIRFLSKFATRTLIKLNQLIFFIKKVFNTFNNSLIVNEVLTIESFICNSNLDALNFIEILEFCNKSKLSQKLHGYSLKYQNQPECSTSGNPFVYIFNFLDAISNYTPDSRIIITKSAESFYLKYLMLNCADYFRDLVQECRAVILAGGTMKPYKEFEDRLFKPSITDFDRLTTFSCKHVVLSSNVACIVLNEGPTGQKFRFSYKTRESEEMIREIGRLISNLCNIVYGGVVCFFTSYFYENLVYHSLEISNTLNQIRKKKSIFREPKDANQVNSVLKQYSACIDRCLKKETNETGALLFSVAGGKLSEGLNFNDDLGRCIVMIGMPYGNIKSVELNEKINYFNRIDNGGKAYYDNLCMKIVNQCIGRAIRHANDYACLLLLDERFAQKHVQIALPDWILDSLSVYNKFGPAFAKINSFFAHKRK